MTNGPDTHIARSADGTSIMYQVSGDGPIDLVWLGAGIPVDLLWDAPGFLRIAKRLSRFSRCIWITPRGWGGSEGDPRQSLDLMVSDADIVAVLDQAAIEKAALVGWSLAAGNAIHFSVTHPRRVSALVVMTAAPTM